MLTTVAAGRVFNHSHCLGMYAGAGQGFWAPLDFAFGADGLMYVINRGSEDLGQRVTRVTVDHEHRPAVGREDRGAREVAVRLVVQGEEAHHRQRRPGRRGSNGRDGPGGDRDRLGPRALTEGVARTR